MANKELILKDLEKWMNAALEEIKHQRFVIAALKARIVRCKDCAKRGSYYDCPGHEQGKDEDGNWFCGDGVRKRADRSENQPDE